MDDLFADYDRTKPNSNAARKLLRRPPKLSRSSGRISEPQLPFNQHKATFGNNRPGATTGPLTPHTEQLNKPFAGRHMADLFGSTAGDWQGWRSGGDLSPH